MSSPVRKGRMRARVIDHAISPPRRYRRLRDGLCFAAALALVVVSIVEAPAARELAGRSSLARGSMGLLAGGPPGLPSEQASRPAPAMSSSPLAPARKPGEASRRWTFDPGPGRDTEVSLAADPRDPDRVLVAWQEDITRVWTARTEDGGRTWVVEDLRDPSTLPMTGQQGFDPTAAIGPDGTMYVLMGVTELPGAITLVRKEREGWSFHPLDQLGVVHLWDAMHLAVAPDTGDLYVVAQSIGHRGIGFWHSGDRGDSWSTVRFPHLDDATGAQQLAQDGYEYWPRLAAGRKGSLLLMTKARLSNGEQVRATVSTDGGGTFGPVTVVTEAQLAGRLVGVPPAFDGSLAVAAYVTQSDIAVLRARLPKGDWSLARMERPQGDYTPDWSSVTARGGSVWILHTEQDDRPTWRVLLTKIRGFSLESTTLSKVAAEQPRGTRAGDEYGGLAVAADGSIWTAWSEPTRSGSPVIRVAHLHPKELFRR